MSHLNENQSKRINETWPRGKVEEGRAFRPLSAVRDRLGYQGRHLSLIAIN